MVGGGLRTCASRFVSALYTSLLELELLADDFLAFSTEYSRKSYARNLKNSRRSPMRRIRIQANICFQSWEIDEKIEPAPNDDVKNAFESRDDPNTR